MATITKKEIIDRISEQEGCKRLVVKRIVQTFLETIVNELAQGNRCEFREFGVFECRTRAPRSAQNPRTMGKVEVGLKRSVKFKAGRGMKDRVCAAPPVIDEATGLAIESAPQPARRVARNRDGAASHQDARR